MVIHCKKGHRVADDPTRPVSWRWLLATHLDQLDPIPPEAKDPWVTRVRHYLAAASADPHPRRRQALDAEIEQIMSIRNDPSPRHRALIEAYLLAGDTPAAMAVRFNLREDVIVGYEQVFFDVSSRLGDRQFIMRAAIEVFRPENYARDPYKLVRAVAYQGGQSMLEAFLALSAGAVMPVPPSIPDSEAATWWPNQQAACRSLVESLLAPDAFEPTLDDQLRQHARQAAERRRAGSPDTFGQCQAAVRKIVAGNMSRLAT